MKEKEFEVVNLEDGFTYLILNEIDYNNIHYLLLSKEDDIKDFCIRKQVNKDGEELLLGLDSEDEFDKALIELTKTLQ